MSATQALEHGKPNGNEVKTSKAKTQKWLRAKGLAMNLEKHSNLRNS